MASIVMLAFVVFPHHHHNEYICFATAHCQDDRKQRRYLFPTGFHISCHLPKGISLPIIIMHCYNASRKIFLRGLCNG